MRVLCHVTEAFNSSGSDEITIGTDVDTDAIMTALDVSTTGVKSCTLGVRAGYGTASPIKLFYSNGGTEPSTGAAVFIIETVKTPPSPI